MKDYGRLTLKIFALIVLNDILDSVAQLLLKIGVAQSGMANAALSNVPGFAFRIAASPFFMSGLAVGLVSYFLWLVILYRIDLSIALPVGSTIYVIVPLMAIIFLHEDVGLVRWTGIVLIMAGVHLVAKSKVAPKGAA